MAQFALNLIKTMIPKTTAHLSGILDGRLKRDNPSALNLTLTGDGILKDISAEQIRCVGILLKSIRENDRDNFIKAQLKYLTEIGVDMELIKVFLRARIRVDFAINNGAGNREIALDIIRLLEEIKRKGGVVATMAHASAISAGAYIWMTGNQRYARSDSGFLWHTRPVIEGHSTQEDKNEDLAIMRPFFEQAKEPNRSKFLQAIDSDDQGCHKITTYGETLMSAGLASPY